MGRLVDSQTVLKPLKKIGKNGNTIFEPAESFKTMNRPGPTRFIHNIFSFIMEQTGIPVRFKMKRILLLQFLSVQHDNKQKQLIHNKLNPL